MPGCFATVPSACSGPLTLLRTCGSAPHAAHDDRKSVGSDGGRAGILAQKPASGEPSEGFGRMVASLDRKRLGADFWVER